MAVRKTTASDQEHCDTCDADDCDHPAHERLKKEHLVSGSVAQAQIDTLTKRAEAAEARVRELEPLVTKTAELETTLAKMRQTPEEQEAEYLASLPDAVRKKYEADQLEKVDLRKRLAEADERVAKADLVAKTADFRAFGMVPEQHWTIVKAIHAMPEADRDELLRLITANMAQRETAALYTAQGYTSPAATGTNGSGSANDQLMALAHTYAKEQAVTLDKAIDAVAKAHPDLWRRDQLEKRATHRIDLGTR